MHLSKNILLKVDAKNLPSAVFFSFKRWQRNVYFLKVAPTIDYYVVITVYL
jgi:hypothetical protein